MSGPDPIATLNAEYGLPDQLEIVTGEGGLPVIAVNNREASARIALHGGHVLSYAPHGDTDWLWLSQSSHFEDGQPIRGGVPVCWPWFGAHPTDPSLPNHGIARTRAWRLASTIGLADGSTRIRLELTDDDATRALWPRAFQLALVVTVGRQLTMRLESTNRDTEAMSLTMALHTYFAVGDVSQASVSGLEGRPYLDTVNGANTRHTQSGPITFAGEVDRVYQEDGASCMISAGAIGRRLHVAKTGSASTVVWNPWIAKAARMPDFGDQEYPEMLCVETANALDQTVVLAPGATHAMTQTLTRV